MIDLMRLPFLRALSLGLFVLLQAPAEVRSLTILHTNDLHSRLTPNDQGVGGFAQLATAIRQERAKAERSLLLNAGDLAQGSPVSTVFHGLPVFEIANKFGFDAATLGNHDFDYGWMQTRRFIATANYPIVSANLANAAGELFTARPYVVLTVKGLRVAVIGAMTEDLGSLTTPKTRGPWSVAPLIESVRKQARAAAAESDLVVLLAHIGPREEKTVLESLPEIPVTITGHAHDGIEEAFRSGDRVLIRCKGDSAQLGRLDLQVDTEKKAVVWWTWRKIAIEAKKLEAAPDVAADVKKWNDEVTRRVDQPLATCARALEKPEVRKLMEQAMREMTGADFAFVNSGGVRDVLPAGQLLVRHIWNIMPFDNVVVFGKFKGKDLPAVVREGRQVEPEREYTLAVTDFTAANQSARSQLQTTGLQFPGEGPLLRDLLIDWFRKKKTID
jgi:2',3'-cyclic-nucleotide 2'-phosphodiesterase (5'-nucleotidase family)